MGKKKQKKKDIEHLLKKGYRTSDTWDIDAWFMKTMEAMLKEFNENLHGFPLLDENYDRITDMNYYDSEECEKRWDDLLNHMIFLLHEMRKGKKNPYERAYDEALEKGIIKADNYDEIRMNWMNAEEENYDYKNNCKNEFFELFSKVFWELWD